MRTVFVRCLLRVSELRLLSPVMYRRHGTPSTRSSGPELLRNYGAGLGGARSCCWTAAGAGAAAVVCR